MVACLTVVLAAMLLRCILGFDQGDGHTGGLKLTRLLMVRVVVEGGSTTQVILVMLVTCTEP